MAWEVMSKEKFEERYGKVSAGNIISMIPILQFPLNIAKEVLSDDEWQELFRLYGKIENKRIEQFMEHKED